MSSLRRSPRLAEKAAKKAAEKPVEKASTKVKIDLTTPNKQSLNYLLFRSTFMGVLYKNMIPGYAETVKKILGTLGILMTYKDCNIRITYRNYLYNALKNAVDGYMFFHPDDIASVKKDYKNDFHAYAKKAKDLIGSCSETNIDHFIDVLYHFIEDPILISKEPRLRHVTMDRLKLLEDYIVKKGKEDYEPAKIVIMKAHVTLTLLPLRSDFVV